jgi:serine protease Do
MYFYGLSVLCILNSAAALSAQDLNIDRMQEQIFDVIKKTSPAIVEISRRGALFSGVIVSPQGHVLSAGHTVTPGQQYNIAMPDGRRLRGRSLGASEQMRGEQLDCALIKIEDADNLPFVPIGSSANLQMHQPCLSISYPGGQRARRWCASVISIARRVAAACYKIQH